MKTSKSVLNDIVTMLRYGMVKSHINGDIYRAGLRPRDSRLEDAVVSFVAGTPGQIQEGVVAVHVFVPDIDPYSDGVMVEDMSRTAALERVLTLWAENLHDYGSNYLFRMRDTVKTVEYPEIAQHAVVLFLRYRYYGGDEDYVIGTETTDAAIVVEYEYPKIKFIED